MQYGGFTLDPFQEQSIAALDRGENLLVAAPTGAGKTLIAEYAIDQAMARRRQIVYTAPIKALSNQKFRDFSAKYPDRVGILTGDVSINYRAPCMIMTTEIFRNTLLDDPDRLAHVDYVIFDEFHFINDVERGTVWEESVIFAPPPIRFICLSATMPNAGQIAGWMREVRGSPVAVVVEEQRPVPLEHALWVNGYGLRDLGGFEGLIHDLARRRQRSYNPGLDAEALLDHVEEQGRLPCLYFCFNRRLCEVHAEANASRELLSPAERREVARLYDELCDRFGVAHESGALHLRELVRHGVAYHHAGILPTLKEVVERLFTSGLIKMLFATETFALGVNMPAATVVLDSVAKFHGTHFGYLRARGYQQMAGRAGRRGMDEVGYVYACVDVNEVTVDGVRHVVAGRPERVESQFNLSYATILSLYDRLRERLYEVCDRSLAFYQRRGRRSRRKDRRPSLRKHVDRRLELLRSFGYLAKRGPTAKGRFAMQIAGYELPATELAWGGFFDDLGPHETNMLVSAMIYECRPGDRRTHVPRNLLARVRRRAVRAVRAVHDAERRLGIPDPVRKLDFRLALAVLAWSRGNDFDSLAAHTSAADGDIIRTLRMTIQMLRQLRKVTGDDRLKRKFREAERCINRGAVDAERQLRAGCDAPPADPADAAADAAPAAPDDA